MWGAGLREGGEVDFGHTSPGGGTLFDRMTKSGFVSGYAWEAGETIAWGTGVLGKPGHIVKADWVKRW
jgi:uncharacterized protein YkwD